MPVRKIRYPDTEFSVRMGRDGLNFRDQPIDVPLTELIDGVNWRLDERGALIKRLGYAAYATGGGVVNQASAGITELYVYRKAGATAQIICACSNGTVQRTPDDGTFTNIKTGLNAARPAMVQFNNVLYYLNPTDGLQSWDGTTWAAVAAAPAGTMLAVWRNRLWISGVAANPKRVYWSNILDAATWAALNFVDVPTPDDEPVTAMATAPNIGTGFDGSDGVLVFTRRSTHRIYDDTDNVAGAVVGGANVLVDGGEGCIAPRSIVNLEGRLYLVNNHGIHSTDGHTQLRLESAKLGPTFFQDRIAQGSSNTALICGTSWQGNILMSIPGSGGTSNSMVLEVYVSHPWNEGHPIMAMNIPAGAFATYAASTGDKLYFADASSGDTTYLRRMFSGGTDVDASATTRAVSAYGRSGANLFGWERQKRMRRIMVYGRGNLIVGVSSDLADSIGETQGYNLAVNSDTWGDEKWNDGTWGPAGGSSTGVGWYTRRGRYFTLHLTESGSSTASPRKRLSISGGAVGGAALYEMAVRLTPLGAE